MKINEIFYSLQGEGKWAGLPNIFIRTSGCNLRCSFCDTKYAYENGKEISIEDIFSKIAKYDCKYVCITGGEPLLQENIIEFIETLLEKNYYIIVETNGSINIENLIKYKSLIISIDIKCPSSNMDKKNKFENINFLKKEDQIKFVIKNKEDYIYAKKIIRKYKPTCDIFFQPVWGENPKKIAEWIIKDRLNVKLSLQLHKILWGVEKGV
ncbi:MAG: radical SAM protein [Thermoplasmatales archaeon]|nr:MAG: radical SAM protein [Thermoplasmatales archaeon]